MIIAQVSKKYDLTPDTLRYYERIGLIPAVRRTPGGIRDYSENDCGWVEFVKCMRSAGIPVETLIEYVSLFGQGDATGEARKQILVEQRDHLKDRIKEMQSTLERLNGKIEHYQDIVAVAEHKLIEEK